MLTGNYLHRRNEVMPYMQQLAYPLSWIETGDTFPPVKNAWPAESDAPGLLAAGGDLNVSTLLSAYSGGIFPWFSQGQPILWWSPDPRMVLRCANFKLHRSLKKTVAKFIANANCEIRMDTAFQLVIEACASQTRRGQSGTWILPEMVHAYLDLHRAGYAHSVETWVNGELVGGLYCVAMGQAVFGESMFTKITDGSKIALAALVAFCRANQVKQIDCQQNTSHLASMGAAEMSRATFLSTVRSARQESNLNWQFSAIYWQHILSSE